MSVALIVLLLGLLVAGISAAVGVAAATVSQHELTRWVSYKLRGSPATASALQNPGRTLATANMLTTLGVLLAAGAIPASLAALLTSADTDALATTDEMAVVSGVLAFADRPVRELMTPRTAIVAFPEGILTAEAAHVLQQSGYSRYPVYRGSLDEVVGVAHTLDLLGRQPEDPIRVRPPLTIPGTMRAGDLMLEMQRGGQHLAVVLDEFGGTAGLVTFEDLLRDLVSELFEPTSSAPDVTRVVEVEGTAPATELGEQLGVPLVTAGPAGGGGGAQPVGGLPIQALGRIPRAGERFTLKGLEFDVLAASATRVERIAVRRGPVRTIALGGSAP